MRHSSTAACTVIPPYVMERLAESGDPALEARARETLAIDAAMRGGRRGVPGARPEASSPPPPPSARLGAPSRAIHDAEGSTDLPGRLVRGEGDPPTGDVAVTEAFDGLGATWELFHAAYGRDSLDGKGMGMLATVHYGQRYDNAFWDGSQMVFGDGDGEIFLSFTRSVDVIGHELAHGVTQFTSGLNYQGQSGALNESVSDVFGVLVRQRLLGQSAEQADWLIGADLLAEGVQGVALRSMEAPGTAYDDPRLGRDPQPGHMRDYVDTTDDNGGVHINSGIPNRAFVLVAQALGGRAWEAPGQIWYDTVTGDISADCDFVTFAGLTLTAAESRYGAGSPEAQAVTAAWAGVGVTSEPVVDEPAPPGGRLSAPGTLRVSRTGGVAGIRRERVVHLDELSEQDTAHWHRVLQRGVLPELAAAAPEVTHPDALCYGVECLEPAVDVTIPEPALNAELRDLLDRTLRGD